MGSGFGIRPPARAAESGRARPGAAQTASAPELPGAKAVAATAEAAAGSNQPPRSGGADPDYQFRDVSIDVQSREVIYRVVEARSRRLVRQKPDETLLRNRAYAHAIENGTSPPAPESLADIEA
jgi:hypothetical protein